VMLVGARLARRRSSLPAVVRTGGRETCALSEQLEQR